MSEDFPPNHLPCPSCGGSSAADSRFCRHCAFDFTTTLRQSSQAETLGDGAPKQKRYALLAAGLAATTLVLVLATIWVYRSRHVATSIAAAPSQTMTEKAKQVEARILQSATVTNAELAGLSSYELRVLRNVHFARYGRVYDRPGLGDYFYTSPWYKPDANYNDNLLTATDKANINLILAQESRVKAAEAAAANATATSAPIANTGSVNVSLIATTALTKEKAQIAVDQALAAAKQQFGRRVSAFAKGIVEGVQDLPQENLAKADVTYVNAETACMQRQYPWTQGVATFKRYNDGRWVLTEITTGEIMCLASWSPNIEVR